MENFAIYYIEALIVCIMLFAALLVHNHFSVDRQEKQIKFDRAMIAFIIYFLADIVWAGIVGGYIPKTRAVVVADTFLLYVFMAAIVYFWMEYALAVEQTPNRNRPANRFAVIFPFLVTTAALVVNYIVSPQMLISDKLETQPAFSIYLMITPIIYLVAILFYTLRQARKEEDRVEKRKHIFLGTLPVVILLVGIVQELFFPRIPIYCFADSLLMLIFYIRSIDEQVSQDPLTNLNNRSQLRRYISQKSNLYVEGRLTAVIMMDVDDFKLINDNYGHAEGDKALTIIAEAFKKVAGVCGMPVFVCRYGGDEFILVIHPNHMEETEQLIGQIRDEINLEAKREDRPYRIEISAGYDEMMKENDSIQACIRRADNKLYQNKKMRKGL